ncbi:DUF4381 family protein [Flammeovirga yaeyamensis]|uniref:DUF4381 family protein n=1 Tax=Flammeovirga yaeyamensis TaxID=367791 RepID=A0AAX1N3Y7_9BACT|nr:DUF4381 domain-containing protein [Flammeovirga yaeyamensis]MBB3699748.1 hypothetical protein [Flammeovirga yaeyamensis]NMF36682.1 DUF4381 domain-containing protein [Flammeovirga yaeyamensis]QWG02274.1 DUF4381 family protein [Flammeovirga yaeyamensis]
MNAQDINTVSDSTQLANQVLDFIPPEKVDMTPNAIGWWIIAGLVGLVVLVMIVKWYINYLNSTYRRTAIQQIDEMIAQQTTSNDKVYHINQILKRVALTTYSRTEVASLQGAEWVSFLNDHSKSKFNSQEEELMINAPYMKTEQINNVESLATSAKKWIKSHV